jgi:hypothetical protein
MEKSANNPLLKVRRTRGSDSIEVLAGNSMAWLIVAVLLIVLAAFGLIKFGPELWQFLQFSHTSLTHSVVQGASWPASP